MNIIVSLVKWLFTLNQLMWFVVGGLSFSAITYFFLKLKDKNKPFRLGFTFIVFSALTFAFAALWAYDSYLENEVTAANMGLLIFGGLAVGFAIVAHRVLNRKPKIPKEKSTINK